MSTAIESMPLVDIDTHFTEPPDLWKSRAPAALRDVAPRVVMNDAGKPVWIVGRDLPLSPPGFCVIRGDGSKVSGRFSLDTFEEMTPAASEAAARVRAMDELGIRLQIVYPNILGFAGGSIMRVEDAALRKFCVTAYNDGVAELQARAGGRLLPQALIPFWDVKLAVEELERCQDRLGLSGFTMTDSPEAWGQPSLNDAYWNPLWAVAQERGLPVNFHIGSGGTGGLVWGGMDVAPMLASISTILFMNNMRCLVNLIFSGLLDRFPSLNFVSVESGIGWIPFLLEACDDQLDENAVPLKLRPREYFARQIYASFWFERDDVAHAISRLGSNNVMVETDFPHPTCLYPGPRKKIEQALAPLPVDAQRKVLYENAARVYHLDLASLK
jgi:predicted TIM-barrel fold metal-dependent hydrolase